MKSKTVFMQYFLFILLVSFFPATLFCQQITPSEYGTFALTGATIETVTNGVIQGTLVIRDGKIGDIGPDAEIPEEAQVIDCSGLTIYPGMIDAGTTLGLSEVGSISLTQDANEIGEITPHVQALTAVNPNSIQIPVNRVNGVTTVLTKPTGGLLPGTAALIHLHGYTPKQMDAGARAVLMNFPATGRRSRWDRRSDEVIRKDNEKAMKRLNDTWEDAVLYAQIHKAGETKAIDYNPQMDALVSVVEGDAPLFIEANKKEDIIAALHWAAEKEVQVVLTGVAEGWRVIDSLLKYETPVITGPVLSTPRRASDRYDIAYKNAGLMQKAGIAVALRTNDSENVRNLPYNAGFAAAYGMGRSEALRAVTIVPAEIFGVSDQIGSLEKGKTANLFVADGDPFETRTQIRYLFIQGWKVPLESRHTRLYDEFLDRNPGLRN